MDDKNIIIERVFTSPKEQVYNAWLEPDVLKQWFYADEGWSTPYAEIDAKEGGKFKIAFKSPDGKNDFDFEGIYNKLLKNEKIVLTIGDGRPVSISFADEDGKTKQTLVFEMENINSRKQQEDGWTNMINHLENYLAKNKEGNNG